MPAISGQLGKRVRTNAESLIGVRVPGSREDLSQGVAIGSGVYIDEHTHIEATRYPRGSDAMGLLATLLTGGRPGWNRVLLWLGRCCRAACCAIPQDHPLSASVWLGARVLILPACRAWKATSTCASAARWYWPFGKVLVSRGQAHAYVHPAGQRLRAQDRQTLGGTPMSMVTEILFDIPGTAHILGGCTMGARPPTGVVDHRGTACSAIRICTCATAR